MRIKLWLEKKRQLLYLLFLLPQVACVSLGVGSSDLLYRTVFALGLPFLFLCIAGTKYEKRELILMVGVVALTAVAFFNNGNRSLILACMAVFGCKAIDVPYILRYSFRVMLVGILGTVMLSAFGILPNIAHSLPKEDSIYYTIYSYGFDTPNNLYFHLVILVLLFVVLYEEKMNYVTGSVITLVMYAAYKILFCRTGWACYLVFVFLYIIYRVTNKRTIRGAYMKCLTLLPIVLALLNWGCIYAYSSDSVFTMRLDNILNHRISLASIAFEKYGVSLFGSVNAEQLDMLYATMLLDYGIILSLVCVCVYVRTMRRLIRYEKDMAVIAMAIVSVYSFMEVNAINPMWNPFLLYISGMIFRKVKEELDG